MGSIADAAAGLVAVVLLWSYPPALILLGVVVATLAGSYRAYVELTEKHRSLQALHDLTQKMASAIIAGRVLPTLLQQTRELMHAERGWLLIADADGTVVRSELREGSLTTVPIENSGLDAIVLQRVESNSLSCVVSQGEDGVADELLDKDGVQQIVAARLAGPTGLAGTLVVADRRGDIRRFSAADRRLLETLAIHAGVSLQNAHLVDRLKAEAADKEYRALHDALTGLPNRTLFLQSVLHTLAAGRPFAVLLLDLDRFKEVNDTLGHHNGDALLQEVGTRLRTVLRRDDTVARLGGDEFAVLLPGMNDGEAAAATALELVSTLEKPFMLDQVSVDVGGSIGIALAPEHGHEPSLLLRRADVAMYEAKAQQTSVEVYRAESDVYSPERLALASELRIAIQQHELEVHYQPQVDLAEGRVIGAEALVRWPHRQRGSIPPDEFIYIAEHTGLIRPLTRLVMEAAISECEWWRSGGRELRVSVNVSARDLLETGLDEDIDRLVKRASIPTTALCVELTETSMMRDLRRGTAMLEQLAELGVTVAVDDFGTGHSSLAYLQRLPVGELKIDRSFVQAMSSDGDDFIVRSIIDLGNNLGLPIVAEGVETIEEWDRLRELGCDLAQGYFIARPMPADDFRRWLADHPDGFVASAPAQSAATS